MTLGGGLCRAAPTPAPYIERHESAPYTFGGGRCLPYSLPEGCCGGMKYTRNHLYGFVVLCCTAFSTPPKKKWFNCRTSIRLFRFFDCASVPLTLAKSASRQARLGFSAEMSSFAPLAKRAPFADSDTRSNRRSFRIVARSAVSVMSWARVLEFAASVSRTLGPLW